MKLNIHIISHPIVKHLYSLTEQETTSNIQNQWLKQLGLFLIYETIRNWLTTYSIAIKQIHNIKKITIIDPKESYIIIANTSVNLSFIQETQYLLPKSHIKLINLHNRNFNQQLNKNFFAKKTNFHYTKAIIMTNKINVDFTLATINHLIDETNISINNIRLTCLNCETHKLLDISNVYPLLNIFTTSLINTT